MMARKIISFIAVCLLVAGLGFLLFPPVSNYVGIKIARKQAQTFDRKVNNVITVDDDHGTGVTAPTYEEALELKQIDKQAYPIDSGGNRTSDTPVVFKADLDRLRRDSLAYNEDLKTNQGSKFQEGVSYNNPALDLRDYGIFDGVFGYISAPSIDMTLPIYLGTSDANMSYGAAHMTYTSLPLGGKDTNASVAGHTGYVGRIFFDNIRNLSKGDRVYVKNFWETLTYEVVGTDVVRPNEAQSMFIQKDRDLFTMFTCAPYDANSYGRYFVICERVS